MPGFSAAISRNGAPVARDLLRRMDEASVHRGPQTVVHVDGAVAMAYRGADDATAQRHLRAEGRSGLTIVLVGQLYNRGELADALELRDADAVDDAALILLAYRRWDTSCTEHLDGDFSFVLHDAQRQRALCARDALGMYPLYYALHGHRLLAGAEPRQLLAAGVSAEPCDETIAAYLAGAPHLLGGARSFYRDVYRVAPGHWMAVGPDDVRQNQFWRLDPDRRIDERDDEAITEHVRALMADATRRRVPETGPYGCALTGGYDSSSVVGLFRRTLDERGIDDPIETFSFEFRDDEADEPELIEAVSRQVRSNHHHIYLDRDNALEVLPRMVAACEEPTLDMGLLCLWRKKEEAARLGVPIVLSGLGGDELFLGRHQYLADLLRTFRLRRLWREIRGVYPIDHRVGMPISLRQLLQHYVVGPLVSRRTKRTVRELGRRQWQVRPWINPELARRTDLLERVRHEPPRLYRDCYRQDCWEVFKSSIVDLTLPLHESLGSAFGVETRFPLLDRRLVEYLFAAPREMKIHEGATRIVQRRAMAGVLPEVVLEQHVKKNLNPVLRRQQRGHLVAAVDALLGQPRLRCDAYIDPAYLRRAHRDFVNGRRGKDAGSVLWCALNLEHWLRSVESRGQIECERDEG